MATYFLNSEIQSPDGLQTLVLMNPGLVQYSDSPSQSPGNLVFLNSAATNSLTPQNLPHAPPTHTQQFVGIPLSAAPNSQSIESHHDISTLHGFLTRTHYNLWNPIDPSPAARDTPRAQQGLSLSLSPQQPGFGSYRDDHRKGQTQTHAQQRVSVDHEMRVAGGSPSGSGITNGVSGIQGVLMSSKYLKAAQELLDEVVSVGNDGIKNELGKNGNGSNVIGQSSGSVAGDGSIGAGSDGKHGVAELSTAERQEIQMKKAKLISMLDEVEQRYRQYHHQMQIVISSFEQAAGIGSARTYTSLALQTISKQFRCLKDAITGQIRAANNSLGEEDNGFGGKFEGSRLKYVDHQLRQQRALQQLGMIQHNAWRPQRGLPERSVSVLRAWLFEHFLHPYPKDSDKMMLAKQTGLTRSQVSNWFINARVRLWKPMVEEMYVEEIKEQEKQNGSADKIMNTNNEDSSSKPTTPTENQPTTFNSKQDNPTNQNSSPIPNPISPTSPAVPNLLNQSGFSLIGSSELDGITQPSQHKKRTISESINMDIKPLEPIHDQISFKFDNERQNRDGFSFMGNQTNFISSFGQYPIGEIERFDADQFAPRFQGNGAVSLTLGLPHCENLSLSGTHQSFLQNQSINRLGRRVDIAEQDHEFSASSAAFENINVQNRKRFAARLLPDFVA